MLRPSRRSPFRRQASARLAPSQTAAASSKLTPAGLCANGAVSGTQTYSAFAPDLMTPKTSSPTWNSVTAAPTASISPASSMPRIFRFGRRRPVKKRVTNSSAERSPLSVRVTVVAWSLTRTSSSLGTGCSTSSSRRTSGGPYLEWMTAFMRVAEDMPGPEHEMVARERAADPHGRGDRGDLGTLYSDFAGVPVGKALLRASFRRATTYREGK